MTVKNYGPGTTELPHELVCEECQSPDIIQTEQGYVCAQCGLVLDRERMEYHRPYEQTRLQHSTIHNTTIGTSAERSSNKRSRYMNRLAKIHNTQTKPENTMLNVKARRETRRILSALDLPGTFEESIFEKFKMLYARIEKQSKFRAPRKLVPVIIFHYCRKRNIPLNSKEFLSVCKLSQTEFREGRYLYLEFYPEYFARDRVSLIKNYVSKIAKEYGLGNKFFENALRIANYFWKYLINTTDAVIAGLVSSIAVLCDYNGYKDKVSINEICKAVNIRASTINSRIASPVVKQLKIKGFESPVKSHELINVYIHKFEILPRKEVETVSEVEMEAEPMEAWAEFTNELAEMIIAVNQRYNSIPLHYIPIPIEESEKTPELHIFLFPDELGQNEVIQTFSHSGENEDTSHYGFAAQKGPPWKDIHCSTRDST